MSLTENGLQIKTFRDIVSDVQQRLDDRNTNILITDESNKVVNNFANPIILSLAEVYEFLEEVYNSFDIMSATGTSLDRLVMYKNIRRLEESYSTGYVEFFCNNQVTVNTNIQLKDTRGRILYVNENKTLGTGSFRSFNLSYDPVSPVTDGVKYYIVLNGKEFSYTATAGQNLQDVVTALQVLISAESEYNASFADNLFSIQNINNNNVSTIFHPVFTMSTFSILVATRSSSVGTFNYPANTVTTLVTVIPSVTSVNNPFSFDEGRLEESDEELRTRFLDVSGATGRATADSIIKFVEAVDGVISVNLINNIEDATSPEGLPPKSFEVIVQGGDDQTISDTILSVAPAGIESYGTTSTASVDSKGTVHNVKFTRPEPVYIFTKVDYELYEEFKNFPVDGEELIRNVIAGLEGKYLPNQDVIPSSLKIPIYQNVQGIGEMIVTCGYSEDGNDVTPPLGYSEDRVSIGVRSVANFSYDRVVVNNTTVP